MPSNQEYLPLINMKGGKHLGRNTSIIKDPQVLFDCFNQILCPYFFYFFQIAILTAIEEHDSELLTAILTEESAKAALDLNHVYDQDGQTLLHAAIENNNYEAVRLLVAASADCNVFNRAKLTPIHSAARKGQVAMLQILLGSGKADVNAAMSNGETILHVLARKCHRSNLLHNLYLECLKLALRAPGVQVDVAEKTADMTPLFVAVEEAKSREAAVVLIKANADVNLSIDNINLREALVEAFGEDILEYQPNDLESAMKGLELGNRSSLLKLLNESVIRDTLEDFKRELESLSSAEDINKSAPGVYTLLQVACEIGVEEHLRAMLQVPGVDVNLFSANTEPCLILAAKMGNGQCLQVLLDHAATDVAIHGDLGTVLHTLFRKPIPNHDYDSAYNHLVNNSKQWRRLRSIVNQQDGMGNTALHYATQFWPQSVVAALLELGANIGLKNMYGEVPINKILPEVMEEFLNTKCLNPEGDVTNANFKITAIFDFLVPFGTSLKSDNKVNDVKNENELDKVPLPETEGLWYMSQSKKHRHLLKHPVIAAFLWMKWKKIGFAYNANLAWFMAFVALITTYIFMLYPGNSLTTDAVPSEACSPDARVGPEGIGILWVICSCLLLFLALREVFQFGIAPRRYIFTLENWVDVTLITLTSILLFHGDYGCHVNLKRHLSAFIIVLSWSELITMIGRHPKLTEINIYVTMLYRVLGTFILFLTWYSLFIIAFALGFYILLHQDHKDAEDHDYLFFDSLGMTIIKTFTMFVGELEFGDLPIKTGFGYIFLLGFVFLIVVVLMNLLNGLAVSDTGVIRAEAEVYAYKTQVEIISYMESTILGDPFNFLANWPTYFWLRKLPTCSPIGQGRLYRVPQLRKLFHGVTRAKNIMLFQGSELDNRHPKGYSVTFMPNQDNVHLQFLCSCCSNDTSQEEAAIENLPQLVAESAKDKVLETIQAQAEAAEKSQLEDKLNRLEAMLFKLLESSKHN